MKKEILISTLIIVCVIIGNIITQNYTKKSIEVINKDLIEIREGVIKMEKNDLSKELEKLKKDWDEMQEVLSTYIEHDELEKVEAQISMIEGNIETRSYKELIPELEKCIFILKHIGDKTSINIKNIF